ncbi:hypothetical protein [Amycolatopsis pithecellobii]|uniref:Uncharacterized protein n=1 Tax=Amycolatopsis pithecellobii TaxID=664692 RepID=A0A6N7Z3N3_9PSEU|nr:hypothetical protein [Amycolatopsis pithecellobii]MTD54790.1 hypothetical protein [Amycolatopsis pithecellobii]
MSEIVTDEQVAADWVGCLVLAVAPKSHVDYVGDAIDRAESAIFGDPVLVDMARVVKAANPDPLGGDLDEIALTLYGELVGAATSPARIPAPRLAFCILLLHSNVSEAERLARDLAATSALSKLPIVFRVGGLAPETSDEQVDITRMILDAATATAHEVDRTPGFCLDAGQLADLTTPRHAQPPRRPEPEPQALLEVPIPEIDEEVPPAAPEPEILAPRRVSRLAALGRVAAPVRSLLTPRPVPASNIEVINELSARADSMSLLYLVQVSEPVRPSREQRNRRAEVALTLTHALRSGSGEIPWYVRAFAAGRELHPGRPLPEPDLLRHKDFPQRWGEHPDLYEVIADLSESLSQDKASFVRRRRQPRQAVVVFLSGPAPDDGAELAQRLAELQAEAKTIWISGPKATVPARLTDIGTDFLHYHEDLLDELLDIIGKN